MFFVLSTGRAGSKTVAETLSQAPDCECLHEPEPRLIEEATRFRYGTIGVDEVASILQGSRRPEPSTVAYGETNNKHALIVPALEQAFAGNKYVWLVRDGRDFVSSAYQRGWFTETEQRSDANPWQRWRPHGDLVGDVDPATWSSWGRFERCCWIWDYTNRLIRRDLGDIGANRWRLLRIEELAASMRDLCRHLDITVADFVVGRANRRTTGNDYENRANHVNHLSTWQDWTDDERQTFARRCGNLMDELYPTWRTGEKWVASAYEVDGDALIMAAAGAPSEAGQLGAIRADLAELKLLRGDLHELRRTLAVAQKQAHKHAERERRMADLLNQTRGDLAATRGRCHRLEADLLQRQHVDRMGRELDRARARATAIESSTAYQFGNALATLVKLPYRLTRRAWRAVCLPPVSAARNLWLRRARRAGTVSQVAAARPPAAPPDRAVLSATHPVHAYVALGFDPDKLRTLARAARQRQIASASHVPLIITDSPLFPLVRDTDVAVEHIPDREAWERHREDLPWSQFRSMRLAHLMQLHSPAATYVLDPNGDVALRTLLDVQPG